MLADAQYKGTRGAGLGLLESSAHPSSGLRTREFAAFLPWAPSLCTGHQLLSGGSASVGNFQQTNNAATFAEPVVNSSTWKEIKVTNQRLPFPCTPVVRYRETAGDDTWATASTGGASFKIRLTGYDQYDDPVVYEMPDTHLTLANNATGYFDAADNRAQDTILHVPTIFSQITKIEYQASGVHANQDYIDVGVAFAFDSYPVLFHLGANNVATGGPSLTKWGTRQPSVRMPWIANQAIGLNLHLDGRHVVSKTVQPVPEWTKMRYGIEVLNCYLKNVERNYGGGGEAAVLPPAITAAQVTADAVDAAVLNGHTALSVLRHGYYVNQRGGLNGVGNNRVSTDRISFNVSPSVSALACLGDEIARVFTTATSLRTLIFTAASKTIQRNVGSWVEDGYGSGTTITVAGSASNNGSFTVGRVTDKILTLISTDTLVNETNTNGATLTPSILGPRNFGWTAHRSTLPAALDGDGTGASSYGHEFFLRLLYRTVKNSRGDTAGLQTVSTYPT